MTMLVNARTGETVAERYRACRLGLGVQGGRFYRHRAACMGMSLGLCWRFEFSQRAAIEGPDTVFDFAGVTPGQDRP